MKLYDRAPGNIEQLDYYNPSPFLRFLRKIICDRDRSEISNRWCLILFKCAAAKQMSKLRALQHLFLLISIRLYKMVRTVCLSTLFLQWQPRSTSRMSRSLKTMMALSLCLHCQYLDPPSSITRQVPLPGVSPQGGGACGRAGLSSRCLLDRSSRCVSHARMSQQRNL